MSDRSIKDDLILSTRTGPDLQMRRDRYMYADSCRICEWSFGFSDRCDNERGMQEMGWLNGLVIDQLLRLCILGHHGAIEIGLLLLVVVVVEKKFNRRNISSISRKSLS